MKKRPPSQQDDDIVHALWKHRDNVRLLAEQFQIYYVTPETADSYQNDALFDDSEVEDVSCSYKQTTHFAAMIAGKMVQGFTNWLAKDELPFRYEEIGNLFLSELKS